MGLDRPARDRSRTYDVQVCDDPDDPTFPPVPSGFAIRHPAWDDLEPVAALFAAVSLARVGKVTVRRGDLRVRWLELATLSDALLIEHPAADPPAVAYAEYSLEPDPWTDELVLHVDGRVHPAWTGHGLATFLLHVAESRARRGAVASGRDSAVLRTTVEDADARARAFFTDRGFVPVRHLLELRLDLHAAPPAPAWPEGVTCRSFVAGRDEERAWRAHQAAFADVTTHLPLDLDDWVADRIGRDPAFDPDLVLIAEHDGQAIGLAVCRAGTEVASQDGWIRDLGVVPAWRRRGVGIALLRTAFAAFRARGMTGAALEVDDVTVDGAVALYRRAGMRVVRRTDVVERPARAAGMSHRPVVPRR